ncbi:MAG: class I SAM-dependent methyltransferase [Treponema sp.]|nr:class I SAM-dependent methyltransferase [Treponema sp.]
MENYLKGNLYTNTADYYDYDNRDIIKDDLDFYVEYAAQTKGPILELGSGTGRVSLYLAEKTRRTVECVELSEAMIERFRHKLASSHKNLSPYLSIQCGDMEKFDLGRTFEYIIIPWRALQYLPEQEQTAACLRQVHRHLSNTGLFIFDIFKPRTYDAAWVGQEAVSYDIMDGDKRIIRSTVNCYANTVKKNIWYMNKIRVIEDGREDSKEDMLTYKYYDYEDITGILESLNFRIEAEFGYYDKRSIPEGDEMIFVCSKKS